MTTTERQAILAANDQFARDGLRFSRRLSSFWKAKHIKEDEWDMRDRRRYGLLRDLLP